MTPFPVWTSALLLALSILGWPQATHAQDVIAQDVIRACYNPAGVLYVIGVPGQPDECRGNDTEVSLLSGGAASGSILAFETDMATVHTPPSRVDLISTDFTTVESGRALILFWASTFQGITFGGGVLNFYLEVDGDEVVATSVKFDVDLGGDATPVSIIWPVELEAGSHSVVVKFNGKSDEGGPISVSSRSLTVRHVE